MKRFRLLLIVVAAVACSGKGLIGPWTPSIAGAWRFSYSGMSGALQGVTVTCTTGALDFTLTHSGTAFSGVQLGSSRVMCSAQGTTVVDAVLNAETIVNGTINGSSISFRLGTVPGQHTGTVSGTSMSGTARWLFTEGNTTLTLNGQFTAAKL